MYTIPQRGGGGTFPYKREGMLLRNFKKDSEEMRRFCFVALAWNVFHSSEIPIKGSPFDE